MQQKDLYTILQVHRDASPEVIKAAYRSLSAKYHPDRDGSADAARQFAEVQTAYEVLSEPMRRRQYDLNPESARTQPVESVAVLRPDGSSTFLTLAEHQRRGWQEAAGCDLSNQDFSGVSFRNAKLAGAKLDASRFIGCDFRGADLSNCSAKRSQFDNVDFAGAILLKVDFTGSSIRGSKFYSIRSKWKSAFLSGSLRFSDDDNFATKVSQTQTEEGATELEATNMAQCDLTNSRFAAPDDTVTEGKTSSSSLGITKETRVWYKQYFRSCPILGCNLSGASLAGCDLRALSVKNSTFESTNLQAADLRKCDVSGVDLSTANLLDTNLTDCLYSGMTKFPEGFPMPNGSKNSDEVSRLKMVKAQQEASENRLLLMVVIGFSVFFLGSIVVLNY
jgi:uncharacterized protein YjbI with pentapeptide repeats